MRQLSKIYIGLLGAILVLAAISAFKPTVSKPIDDKVFKAPHVCIDPTHQTCDGKCECDGMACDMMRDYQIDVHSTLTGKYVIDVYRNRILINRIPYTSKKLGSLYWTIEEDNE